MNVKVGKIQVRITQKSMDSLECYSFWETRMVTVVILYLTSLFSEPSERYSSCFDLNVLATG